MRFVNSIWMGDMLGIPVIGASLPPQVVVPSMAMILVMRNTMATLAFAGTA